MKSSGAVLVTGGNRGIGEYIARGLAAAGTEVVLWGRREQVLSEVAASIEAEGGVARTLVADVMDAGAVEQAVSAEVEAHGAPSGLVNAAGLNESGPHPVWEMPIEDFHRVVAVNVLGVFHTIRAVVPHMIAAGGGRVVNLNSGSALASKEGRSAYNASKAAVFRIGGGLAAEGAEFGIKSFEMSPGVVHTGMTAEMPEHAHRDADDWTKPEEVVALTRALLSGDLDQWSGRMVRAGADSVADLAARSPQGRDRDLGLITWGSDDPLG